MIDSNLTFKSQVKKVCNRVKHSLPNFRYIRNCMSLEAAKMFMNAMIMSHIIYCLTTWSQTSSTTLKPLESLYKQSMKTLDKKTNRFHHCHILKKQNLLSWDNLIKYANLCLVYKVLHNLAPPPLSGFVKQRAHTSQITRGVARGNCIVPLRKSACGQSAFSFKAAQEWNTLPNHIREPTTYTAFSRQLKLWLITHQICQH